MEKSGIITTRPDRCLRFWAGIGLLIVIASSCTPPASSPPDSSSHRTPVAVQKTYYTIEGVVSDTHNRPLEGATVVIVQGTASYPEIAAVTNEKGQFSLGSLEKGTYTVQATYKGKTEKQEVVIDNANKSAAFTFERQ